MMKCFFILVVNTEKALKFVMSGRAMDCSTVSRNAVASMGSNFSIRLCPTDSPVHTVFHFPSTLASILYWRMRSPFFMFS